MTELTWTRSGQQLVAARPGHHPNTSHYEFLQNATMLADLTLMPSPGEQFWLQLNCLDGVLNKVDGEIALKVGELEAFL